MPEDHHLVGRENEFEAIVGLLRPREGPARVGAIVGEPGIGKTSLLEAAVATAAADGRRVLRCRPAETESRLSFVCLGDLLDGADDALSDLAGPQRSALSHALLLDEGEGEVDERAVAVGFLNCLRGLASDQPLLLVVDDAQWADAPSVAALRFALARLDAEPVTVLVAARGDGVAWLRTDRLSTVTLEGLSLGALHRLLRERLDRPPSRPALVRVHETSGGNPFYALELARVLDRRGGALDADGNLPFPAKLDELVAERLAELSAAAESAALATAILGEPSPRLLADVVADAEAAVSAAATSGVLEIRQGRVRFSHPLLASAILARASSPRRRAMHARCADVVTDPERRARHLALATDRPDVGVAGALAEAAAQARARGAVSVAAELARLALESTPRSETALRPARAAVAGRFLYDAGDGEGGIAILEEALAEAAPGGRGLLLVELASATFETRGPEVAEELFTRALEEAAGDAAVEARAHAGRADGRRLRDDLVGAASEAEAAVELAERSGDDRILAAAIAIAAVIAFNLGRPIAPGALERAIAIEDRLGGGRSEGRQAQAHVLFWSNRLDEARACLSRLRDTARANEDPAEGDATWFLALVEWRAGNWEAAEELAETSWTLSRLAGRVGVPAVSQYPRTIIAAHRGRVEEARRLAGAALEASEQHRFGAGLAGHHWVLGFVELSLGDITAALPHLRASRAARMRLGVLEPGMQTELPDLLDALVAAGDLEAALALVEPWQEHARELDRPWALAVAARTRGLVQAARGDLTAGTETLEGALREHERSDDPFQRARTLLALGSVQRRARRRGAARETLETALAEFERLGAPLWAGAARTELARIGGRVASRDELTAGERRVAALVAEGKTNREVAAALFVTERTVEAALTRAYRKLGVRSRTELAARVAASAAAARKL